MDNNLRHPMLIGTSAALAIAMSSCSKPAEPGPPPTVNAATATAVGLGPHFIELRTCAKVETDLSTPTRTAVLAPAGHEFELEITGLDIRDLKDKVKKKEQGSVSDPLPTGKPKPSRWDFDTEVGQPTVNGNIVTYRTAAIKLTLKPKAGHVFNFVAPPNAIRAGDLAGWAMFCDPVVAGNIATFRVFYVPGGTAYGSFNVGVVIEDKSGQHEMTVFLDPEVKNDG